VRKPRVAAVVTTYHRHTHADLIVGKILEGYHHTEGAQKEVFPDLVLVSMYSDQSPAHCCLEHKLAKKHGFPVYPSIWEALTRGTQQLDVDAVLCITEHGMYPKNEIGQTLYPKKRIFDQVIQTIRECGDGQVVPIFLSKHLSHSYDEAESMVKDAEKGVKVGDKWTSLPFQAGSVLPLTWREPKEEFKPDRPLKEALLVGFDDLESYGFHALEGLQCLIERCKGGRDGVKSVQCLQGKPVWDYFDGSPDPKALLEAALESINQPEFFTYAKLIENDLVNAVFLLQYVHGFRATVVMLNRWVIERDVKKDRYLGVMTFTGLFEDAPKLETRRFLLQLTDPFGHFEAQLRAFEGMVKSAGSAKPFTYPIKRTLLTTGVLEAALKSRAQAGTALKTGHLTFKYDLPARWPSCPDWDIPKRVHRNHRLP
jgi:hypothetical protein